MGTAQPVSNLSFTFNNNNFNSFVSKKTLITTPAGQHEWPARDTHLAVFSHPKSSCTPFLFIFPMLVFITIWSGFHFLGCLLLLLSLQRCQVDWFDRHLQPQMIFSFRFISFHLIWFDLICFDVCGLSGGVARCHLAAEPAATLDGFILLISAPRHGDFPIELKRCQNPTGIRRPFPHWLPFPEMKKKPSNSPTGWLIQISAAHSSHSFFPPLSLTRRKFVVPPAPSTSLLDICGRIYLLQLVIIIQKKKGNKPKDNNKNNQTKQQQNKKRLFVSMELDTRFHQLSLIPPQSTTTIKKKKNVWLDLISTVIATAHLTQSWAFKHPFFIYIYIYIYIQLLISNF